MDGDCDVWYFGCSFCGGSGRGAEYSVGIIQNGSGCCFFCHGERYLENACIPTEQELADGVKARVRGRGYCNAQSNGWDHTGKFDMYGAEVYFGSWTDAIVRAPPHGSPVAHGKVFAQPLLNSFCGRQPLWFCESQIILNKVITVAVRNSSPGLQLAELIGMNGECIVTVKSDIIHMSSVHASLREAGAGLHDVTLVTLDGRVVDAADDKSLAEAIKNARDTCEKCIVGGSAVVMKHASSIMELQS